MTNRTKIALSASTILSSLALAATAQAQSLPSGGVVKEGSANIATAGTTQTITQTTQRAVIEWTDFSVASGHSVFFTQPNANAATLNRVTGTTQSTIAGLVNGTGAIYIVNPNGIQITATGLVDVGRGFVASTLDIANADFMAGSGTFGGDGTGSIVLEGQIKTSTNGYVGLLGGQVDAAGQIFASSGTIVIGAVEAATLDMNGGGFLQLVMPGVTPGSSHIAMGAGSARAAVRGAVNLPGSVEATYVTGTNGNVTLSGGMESATMLAAGTGNVTVNDSLDLENFTTAVLAARADIVIDDIVSGSGTEQLILRADAAGTGSGTVTFDSGGYIDMFGTTATVDVFYNPASYTAPVSYGSDIDADTVNAYMLVNDVNQLQAMETNLAGTYALGRDIDASATAGWNGGEGFDPIGSYGSQFTGTLDGQNRAISGLTIDRIYNDLGLFSYLGPGSLVHDLKIEGGSITGTNFVGALTGVTVGGTIRNISSSATVTATYQVGGLVGKADSASIANAFFNGTVSGVSQTGGLVGWADLTSIVGGFVSGAVSGGDETGGLVGRSQKSSIANAFVTGAVSGGKDVGGLIGIDFESTFSDGHVSGRVTGNDDVGGLVGSAFKSNVSNAYWDTYSTGQSAAFGYDGIATLDATAVSSDPTQSGAANYAFSVGTYSDLDLTNSWYQAEGMRPILRSMANPAVAGVIDITNIYQLQLMGANLGASYRLANDIDASLANGSDISGIWDSRGFAPVGDYTNRFTGTFDGQGHIISDLTINRPNAEYVGLFGFVFNATLRNVGLEEVDISGGRDGTGSLMGGARTTKIANVYATGSVSGDVAVGGLGGYLIRDTFIDNAYADVTVFGTYDIGGLVGDFEGFLANTYAMGSVTGAAAVGGLVGAFQRGAISNSYWNIETTGQATSSGGGTGLTTAQMQQAASFTTWDISGTGGENTIWRIYEGSTAPLLRSFLTPLTVSPTDAMVTYDGTVHALDSYTLGSGGDPALVFGTLANFVSGRDAGTYSSNSIAELYSTQQGYDLIGATGTLTITPRALTVTADALSRIYGDANPALTYTVGGAGLVGGDTLSGALTTVATAASDVGTYGITQGSLAASSNYTLTYIGADLVITPRALSVIYSADALSRIYGDANPALTGSYSVTGLVNGDTLGGSASWTTLAAPTSDVGSYGVTGSGLTASSNYTLTTSQAAGNATALTITPRALTVTADALSRIYGDANPALSYAIGGMGLVNGDTLGGALATGADVTSDVGSYAITQGTLAASSNYALTYVGADLVITPRALSVIYSADALSRIYGEANPALTGSYTVTGLVNGDRLGGNASWATAADASSDVGSYGVTGSGLAASGNYTLSSSQDAGNATALTVTPRALTVTADALSRIYGDANPALSYVIGGMGLANGDTLGGALATGADVTADVGSYAITQGTLAASSNYALTYVGSELAVIPRALAVVADPQSRLFGYANPALTYSVSGLVNGDSLTGALATQAYIASQPDAYLIDQGTLAASPNYTIDYTPAQLTVTPIDMRSVSQVTRGGSGAAPGNAGAGGSAQDAAGRNPLSLTVDFTGRSANAAETPVGDEAAERLCPDGSDGAGGCQLSL